MHEHTFQRLVLRALFLIMYGLGVPAKHTDKWVRDVIEAVVELDER
jgi:hypothetical protein